MKWYVLMRSATDFTVAGSPMPDLRCTSVEAGSTPASRRPRTHPSRPLAPRVPGPARHNRPARLSGNFAVSFISPRRRTRSRCCRLRTHARELSSTWSSAFRMLIATRPKSPNAKSENAIVTTPSALRSGARREAVSASRTDRTYVLSRASLAALDGCAIVVGEGGPRVESQRSRRRRGRD